GLGGIMDLTGAEDGEPQRTGVACADLYTGLYSVIAIQAALAARAQTGCGQHIDMSLQDCMIGVLANQGLNYLVSGVSPTRRGNSHPNIAPYQTFETRDGWMILAVGNDRQFKRFCELIGLDSMAEDPRFSVNHARIENRDALTQKIADVLSQKDRNELLEALELAGVPASPINTVEQALEDPQVVARNMRLALNRGESDASIPGIRTPIRYSELAVGSNVPAPTLGKRPLDWN
ncbi:MAG: CaiB/BaiF CoA-transferase family protein, partial [Pseudomonadota bacterium]